MPGKTAVNPGEKVVRNGSHRGRQRYQCRTCKTYFGETQGTPMYGLKTPAAEVAQALLIVMRRGSLRAAEELTGHKYETISVWLKRAASHAAAITQVLASDLHLSQVEIEVVTLDRGDAPLEPSQSIRAAISRGRSGSGIV